MKVDLMYSIHCLPHPWDSVMREQGVKVFCLCKEVRLPVEEGHARGKQVLWEPVAIFNRDSDGSLFEEFCWASIRSEHIETRQEFADMKRVIEQIRSERRGTAH